MSSYAERRREWIKGRRNRRNQARRARFNRQVFRYALLLALLWGGVSGMMRLNWTVGDPCSDIVVVGNGVVSTDQVMAALGDVTARKIFQIDPRQLGRRVEALRAVKYAFVRRFAFPKPTIVVAVLEEFPWATFSSNPDGVPEAVISQSGRMIPTKQFPRVAQPPLVIYGQPTLKLTSKDVSQWAAWVAFIAGQTGQPVTYVDLRKPFDVRVLDGDLYLKLGAPDATLTRRLGRLTSILTAIEPLKTRLEYVDLGLDNNIPLKLAKKPADGRASTDNLDHLQQAQLPSRPPL